MTRRFVSASLLAFALAGTAACTSAEEGDGIDDSFVGDGKADIFGSMTVFEGSLEAQGVLAVVAESNAYELDNEAMLDSRAAKAIVTHRRGPDGKDGTADDDPIESLAELDSIHYVGKTAWTQLLEYARYVGAVGSEDPFDDNFCGWDSALSVQQFKSWIPKETSPEYVPTGGVSTKRAGIAVRTRSCGSDACPWSGADPSMFYTENAAQRWSLEIPMSGLSGFLSASLDATGTAQLSIGGTVMFGEGTPGVMDSVHYALTANAGTAADTDELPWTGSGLTIGDHKLFIANTSITSSSQVGAHCAYVRINSAEGSVQREVAVYARY